MKIMRIGQQMNLNLEGEESVPPEIEDISSVEYVSANEIKIFCFQNNIEIEPLVFETGKTIYLLRQKGDDDTYVMEDWEDKPSIYEVNRFFHDLNERELDEYYHDIDFNKEFWDGVTTGTMLYHATSEENWPSIQKNGIFARSKTRAINNRYMSDAVFTSHNEHSISSYGPCVIGIDIGEMKKDGFTPTVGKEDPLENSYKYDNLARKLGIENYSHSDSYTSEGLSDETVALFDDIPPKYLVRMDQ